MIFNITGGGGGSALNFNVVTYTTEEEMLAATPSENTIGIITETSMISWIFSVEEPSPAVSGMVWIYTGMVSPVKFNATKKNPIIVYPLAAKHYIDGNWVNVTAKSWQGGKWVSWIVYLYNNGDMCTGFTDGWVSRTIDTSIALKTPSFLEDGIEISISRASGGMHYCMAAWTEKTIDLTNIKTLTVNVPLYSGTTGTIRFGVSPNTSSITSYVAINAAGKHSLDVESLVGEYYVIFGGSSYWPTTCSVSAKMTEVTGDWVI